MYERMNTWEYRFMWILMHGNVGIWDFDEFKEGLEVYTCM